MQESYFHALLESLDGLTHWFVVSDPPPPMYILPIRCPLRPPCMPDAIEPPRLGQRRYDLVEIRRTVHDTRYAYYREREVF